MRSPRWTEYDPDDDNGSPAPLSEGRLGPPSRKPPTAVGVVTPEPPSEPYHPTRYGAGLTHVRRAAKAALSVMLIAAGGVAVSVVPLGLGTLFGATSVGIGSFVGLRVLRSADIYVPTDGESRKRRRKTGRKGKPPTA